MAVTSPRACWRQKAVRPVSWKPSSDDIDPLFAQAKLQLSREAAGRGRAILEQLIDLYEQVDIAPAGLIVGARAEQPHVGMRTEHRLDGIANGVDLTSC